MLKRYKYELRPTDTQRVQFDQAIGACRLVYDLDVTNAALSTYVGALGSPVSDATNNL